MTGSFVSLDGHTYAVTVGDATGTLTFAADPVKISWDADDHPYVPFRTVSATIRILTQTDLSGLYTADPLGCHVLITKDSGVIFDGFLTPQEWQCPSDDKWNEVELEAVDAVTALKRVAYERSHNYAVMRKPSDFIDNMLQFLYENGADVELQDTLPWDLEAINEQAFLPDDWDASVHSSQRKSWLDVVKALGTFLGGTFMLEGDKLRFFDIESCLLGSQISIGDKIKGIRSSIEPAKSSIVVNYEDTSEMVVVPEMDEERFGTEVKKVFRFNSDSTVDGSKPTVIKYVEAKDWEPTDGVREVCGMMSFGGYSFFHDEKGSEQFCVVGPCQLKTSAKRLLMANCMAGDESQAGEVRYVKIKISGWSGTCEKEEGYAKMPVFSQLSTYISEPVKFYIGQRLITEIHCPIGETGYKESAWTLAGAEFVNLKHGETVSVVVPDGVAVGTISIEISPSYSWEDMEAKLLDREEEYITTISDDYNDSLEVDATLRPMPSEWSVCDVASLKGAKQTSSVQEWTKYPYVNPSQFAVPRKKVNVEVASIQSWTIRNGYTIGDGKVYAADGAEYDLREGRVTLNLLESCVGDEDE